MKLWWLVLWQESRAATRVVWFWGLVLVVGLLTYQGRQHVLNGWWLFGLPAMVLLGVWQVARDCQSFKRYASLWGIAPAEAFRWIQVLEALEQANWPRWTKREFERWQKRRLTEILQESDTWAMN